MRKVEDELMKVYFDGMRKSLELLKAGLAGGLTVAESIACVEGAISQSINQALGG